MGDQPTARERVLGAALAEFAAHGVAGARIDRIAAAARTSKERVYAYFRSKEELHSAALAEQARETMENVHLDVHDIPGYVGEVFDFYVGHRAFLRTVHWARLESPEVFGSEAGVAVGRKVAAVAAAQEAGVLPADVPARDLLAFLFQLATTWVSAVEYYADLDPADPAVVAERRAAAVALATRLFPPD